MKFVPYHCNQHIWVTSFTLVTASSLQQQLANQMQNKYGALAIDFILTTNNLQQPLATSQGAHIFPV